MGEFDLSLISEFRSRPSFYDRNTPRFRDKLYNARQWQEISNKLGFDVSILKDRILQLRNRYNLEKRRIEQLREENPNKYYDSPWPLYDHLHFLSDHIRARRSYRKMIPLNGNSLGDGVIPSHYATGLELSNSCSNNSNLTLRHVTASGEATREQHITAFPNGLLAVKMEDDSEETVETESLNNGSEINAFETAGLIPETHSSSLPVHDEQQQEQSSEHKQQQHPKISIRRLDSLRQDFADSSSSMYSKRLKKKQRLHHAFPINEPAQLNNNNNNNNNQPNLPMQSPLTPREKKYTAFGNFVSSSLLDLPPTTALELVEQFTTDIVRILMENAQQEEQSDNMENQQE